MHALYFQTIFFTANHFQGFFFVNYCPGNAVFISAYTLLILSQTSPGFYVSAEEVFGKQS